MPEFDDEMRLTLDPGNPEHQSLARLIIARHDIKKARKVARLIVERISSEKDELFEPLSCATVIWYARPFAQSHGRPRIPGRYQTGFPSPAQKKIHDGLIAHRNRFEAHADKDFHEVTLVHKATTIEFADGAHLQGLASHGDFIASKYVKLVLFPLILELFDFQLQRLKVDVNKEKERLFP